MAAEAENVAPSVPWKHSEAKKSLVRDMADGKLDGLKPAEVCLFREEHQEHKCSNFASNLKNHQQNFAEKNQLATEDAAALAHDLALGARVNNKPHPIWQGSEAERLLKLDIDIGKHLDLEPSSLQQTQHEHGLHPLNVFCDHIHQELRARKERPCWMARRKEKEEAKQKEKIEQAARKKLKEDEKRLKEEQKRKKKEEKEAKNRKKEEKKRKKDPAKCNRKQLTKSGQTRDQKWQKWTTG